MTRRRIYKHLRIAGMGIIGVALLVGLIGSLASHYYKRAILQKLPLLAAKATDSLYHVSIEDLRINVFTGQVTVYGLRLTPDSSVFAARNAGMRPPTMLLRIYIPEVRLWGVKWNDALKEKELSCNRAELMSPQIVVMLTGNKSVRLPKSMKAALLKDVRVSEALITNPDITVTGALSLPFTFHSVGGNIAVHNWRYIPHTHDTSRFFYAESAVADLSGITYSRDSSLYALSAGSIHFNTDSSLLALHDFDYAPRQSYDSTYAILGHRSALFNFHTDGASLTGFDWRAFIYRNQWRAERLSLGAPDLMVYDSKVPPVNLQPRIGAFPDDFLQEIGHNLYVPYAVISHGTLTYRVQDNRTMREGDVAFNDVEGLMVHLSNDAAAGSAATTLLAQGYLYERSPFSIALQFRNHDTDGHFRIRAALRDLTAASLMRPVEVMALASIRSLNMEDARLNLWGDKDSAEGDISVRYSKLRIKLQHFDTTLLRVKGRNVLSFMANNVFLNPANPMPGDTLRGVHPKVYGNDGLPFFTMVWKLLFAGIQETAIRDKDMMDRFRERRARHMVKKLQRRAAGDIRDALGARK